MKFGNPYVLEEFNPHITIGLVRNQENKLNNICEKLNSNMIAHEMEIDSIHIIIEENNKKIKKNLFFGKK